MEIYKGGRIILELGNEGCVVGLDERCGGGIIEVIIDFEDSGLGKIRHARDELKRQQGM
jgi:hypothetical protein